MRKVSRFTVVLLVVLFIAIGILAGCDTKPNDDTAKPDATTAGKTTESSTAQATEQPVAEIDISKPVELIMYLLGSPARDYDMMLEEANKILKEDLNATVTVNWIGWADRATQYPLLLASGDPIDLIYAATWANFYQNAQKGAFMALEDLAPVYAPKSYAQITPDFMEQSSLDGHLYGMPAPFFQYGDMGYIVRGDLMEEYGIETIDDMDGWGEYLAKVVENDPELEPVSFTGSDDTLDVYYAQARGYYNILSTRFSPFWVNVDDEDSTIINLYETEGILDYFKKMKEWSDAGYWSKSALSNKDSNMFDDGKAASKMHSQDTWRSGYISHPDWDLRYYINGSYTFKTAAMQDGMCVPASSKNPERALMFLERLRTDQKYYNYFTYGIEGVHYEITSDNYLKQLDPDGFAAEGYCSWGFKSLDYYIPPLGAPPNWDEKVAELNSLGRDNLFVLFTPNFDPVKNEWAAIINVIQQYRLPLTYGYIDDPETGLDTLVEKLKEAGADTVMAEMQSQLDAYLGK